MNIEIIPNWHPVFVHFTIGLLSASTILLFSGVIFFQKSWAQKLLIAGHINLWLGAAFTCVTLLAGWQAYNTVSHDGPSHAAMTDHRNWALVTATLWMSLAVWATFRYRKQSRPTNLFLAVLCTATLLLGVTGYKGGEAVYRYGLGVMALPETSGDGGHASHDHSASGHEGMKHDTETTDRHTDAEESHADHGGHAEPIPAPATTEQEHHNHQH